MVNKVDSKYCLLYGVGMNDTKPWFETIVMPALLRHARMTYGIAMRRALMKAGYDDVPKNGMYIIGGMALGADTVPLGQLVKELGASKQAVGQLVDTLVLRGYLKRREDAEDRRKSNLVLTERGLGAAAVQRAERERIDAEFIARAGEENVLRTRRTLAVLVELRRQFAEERDDEH
jgi:DNA-binding MarR family transcriptional regulator